MQNEPLIRQNHDVHLPSYTTYAHAEHQISRTYLFIKRIMDIVLSTIGLIICIPLFIVVAIAIKLDSPGPIIFKQERVGKDGKKFVMYKFRTMVANAEEMAATLELFKNDKNFFIQRDNDPRLTKVGRFMRKFSIDELPQLWNVLKGDMSLIGPRPWIEEETVRLSQEHLRRLVVKPGITGYAQINGRNDLNVDGRIERDLYYVKNCSVWLDAYIFFKTIVVILMRDGVY